MAHRSRTFRYFVYFAALILVAAVANAFWVSRVSFLRSAAEYWIVSDPEGPADAAAIFGGGVETRPFAAAEYYRKRLVHKSLVSNVRVRKTEALGVLPLHADLNRAVLTKLGVPDNDIETFGNELSNSYEEALALKKWALRNGARSIIVPTEIFSSRRVRWICNREFAGLMTSVNIIALDDPEFSRTGWWRNENGVISFQNEIVKYLYYRVRY
jgi:hypothetical protein